jgi:three-Cys-motif partner protein
MLPMDDLVTVADTASPHTIKKFELIEEYVKAWAQKLLNYQECNGIVFIDCMCNSGIYQDNAGNEICGTPIRIANLLSGVMQSYPSKQAWLYFNDLSAEKIEILKKRLPANAKNFIIDTRSGDGNDLLRAISISLQKTLNLNYLLVYDPYTASIDWNALRPFLRNWGEVIINHMVSDSIRGVSRAKKDTVIAKYEQTYMANIDELMALGNDRSAYEQRIQDIIATLKGPSNKQYYIASFPFFNTRNGLVYNLIHCSGHIEGFKLFKKTAWKVFGGKSSSKDTHGIENQFIFDFEGSGQLKTITDEYCYYVKDIVKYLHNEFKGRVDVPLSEVWRVLDEHPVFPSDGYKPEIKHGLNDTYNDKVSKHTITFTR